MTPSRFLAQRPGRRRPRAIAGVLAGAALTALLAGCGGSDSSSSASASRPGPGPGQGGGFMQLTAKQRACVKKQGVTLPSAPSGGQPPSGSGQLPTTPNGQTPPNGQPPTPPSGQAPNGQAPPGGNAEQFQKLQKALKACGVSMPAGPGGGQPPTQGTSGTGASS